MLNVCNNNHEEICYNGHQCPLCCAIAEKDEAYRARDNAEAVADKLQAKVEEMLK